MTSITSKQYFENFAKSIPWDDIFQHERFTAEKGEKIRGTNEYDIVWKYDDGELNICIQTFGEDEPALILCNYVTLSLGFAYLQRGIFIC